MTKITVQPLNPDGAPNSFIINPDLASKEVVYWTGKFGAKVVSAGGITTTGTMKFSKGKISFEPWIDTHGTLPQSPLACQLPLRGSLLV